MAQFSWSWSISWEGVWYLQSTTRQTPQVQFCWLIYIWRLCSSLNWNDIVLLKICFCSSNSDETERMTLILFSISSSWRGLSVIKVFFCPSSRISLIFSLTKALCWLLNELTSNFSWTLFSNWLSCFRCFVDRFGLIFGSALFFKHDDSSCL